MKGNKEREDIRGEEEYCSDKDSVWALPGHK